MREYLEKYKYHIGGTSIALVILYIIYSYISNKIDDSESNQSNIIIQKEPDNKFVKAEISHEEFLLFMKTLKGELQNLTQSLVQFNANQIKNKEFLDFRKNLFTKDIIKKNILVDSISAYKDNQDTSDYIVSFGGSNSPEVYKNVIGFRLVNAIIPYTVYTINDHNRELIVDSITVTLENGSYTFTELGYHLQIKLNDAFSGSPSKVFTVIPNSTTYTYKIQETSLQDFSIYWTQSSSYSHRLFGFEKVDVN